MGGNEKLTNNLNARWIRYSTENLWLFKTNATIHGEETHCSGK